MSIVEEHLQQGPPVRETLMDVVIVDDASINLTLLKHLVARLPDCEPHCFLLPGEGLDWCRTRLPDLIIVDYMMPDLDGINFIRQFRQMPGRENIPVLMVTANDEAKIRYEALEAGANDFLAKPIDRTEFLARTRNMLALRKGQRFLENRAEWLAEEVAVATAEVVARERETIVRLARAAEYRDPETGQHIQRMAHFSKVIAAHLGLSAEEQDLILDAAPMHDVGKVGIPDNILLKPGRLEPDELKIMQTHAELGQRILGGSTSRLLIAASEIAISHHEKFDGSGYPNGLVGEDIPLFGRIVAVADVFDALMSVRPYKKAWTEEEAINLLHEGAGKHFDPACVEALVSNIDKVRMIQKQFADIVEKRS